MKLTESQLRNIVQEELSKLVEVGLEGPFDQRELVYYDPDDFYAANGAAIVLSDRTVNAGGDYKIATIRGMKKYDDRRKYEQSVTMDTLEPMGEIVTVDELDQLKQGNVPQRIQNLI
jgi:hypothetical protein